MLKNATPPTELYIGGVWRPAASGERFAVTNPADETVIAEVASADVGDAMAALDAAQDAFPGWAARKPRERAEVLRKAFELMSDRAGDFARLITLENGKAGGDALGEARYSAEFFRWFAEEAVRIEGQIGHAPSSGARIMVRHAPAGVAVLVTPWNFPAAMGARKIAPALAAGCPVIVKPASETPLTMLALAALLEEAGVPAGVVNVIPSRLVGQGGRCAAPRHAGAGRVLHRLDGGRPQAAALGGGERGDAGDGARRQRPGDRLRRRRPRARRSRG